MSETVVAASQLPRLPGGCDEDLVVEGGAMLHGLDLSRMRWSHMRLHDGAPFTRRPASGRSCSRCRPQRTNSGTRRPGLAGHAARTDARISSTQSPTTTSRQPSQDRNGNSAGALPRPMHP